MAAKVGPTIQEVLGNTPPEKLDQPCKDKHLCHIAREITNWVFLAPFLRVKAPEVEAIRGKWPFNVPAQNLELLRRWKHKHQRRGWKQKLQRKGKDTYRNLCKALIAAQEVTVAEKVCDVLCSQGDSSESSSDESDEQPTMSQPLKVQTTVVADDKMTTPTLEEVLGNTPPEKLEQPCMDRHLCKISGHITDWPALAPLMGITTAEEEEIEGRWPKSIQRQRIELLRKWKQKRRGMCHGKKRNTYRSLCNIFFESGNVALAEKVCDVLCGEGTQSESSGESEEDGEEKPSRLKSGPLEDLAGHVRMSYGCQTPSFAVLQWPPPPTFKVFNLAMIHSKEIVQRTPLEKKLVRLTLRGGVDDIMKIKSSIKLEDLFKHSHQSKDRLVVLIEGAPGSGKSTLAWDICKKWKAQILFHDDFKIVIHVQLRDLDIQSATEIADLLPLMKSKRRDAASVIVDCHGDGVLFVLDGWDEYSPGLQPHSLFEQLICHPENLGIPHSTVLITSRPIASGKLQPYATSRVEIVGFMPNEVGQYFKDVFKDPVMVQKLYNHLKERPTIKASCYLPLNAAIVAHLFMELNYTLPTTLHGLFCSLILSCIIRHMTKESRTQPTVSSLDELPPGIKEVFENICVLAYEGTRKNKVIYSSQDLRSFGLPDDLSTLSLMQVVQSFVTGKPSSYHFLHLSIQELLTALHISKLPPPKQLQIFTKLFGQPRFDAVFRFYAAFTKLQIEGIRSIISQMIQKDKQRLLNLMHCLYEAQDTSLCYFVSSQLKGTLDLERMTLSPLDLLSLKYFLSCVNFSSTEGSDSGLCEMTVSNVYLNGELTLADIDSLSLRNLVELKLGESRVSCASAANLLTNSPQMKLLHLSLADDGVEIFAAAVREHQSLEDLAMSQYANSSHVAHHILQAIFNHRSLQFLDITSCPVDMRDVAAVLEVNESLRVLLISGYGISDSDSVILANSLKRNRTLERLGLTSCMSSWMEKFVWSLRDCHLKMLNMVDAKELVLVQLVHRVNEVRRDRGLPVLVFSDARLLLYARSIVPSTIDAVTCT